MPPIALFSYEECVVRYISSFTQIVFKCGFFSPAMATTGELFFSNVQCAQVKTCLANWKWQTIAFDLTDFSCAQFVSFLYFFHTQYKFPFKSNMNIHGVQ